MDNFDFIILGAGSGEIIISNKNYEILDRIKIN